LRKFFKIQKKTKLKKRFSIEKIEKIVFQLKKLKLKKRFSILVFSIYAFHL